MKFLLSTFIIIFASLSLSAQLVKMDTEIRTSDFLKESRTVHAIPSDEEGKIYYLFPKKGTKDTYEVQIINESFNVISKIETFVTQEDADFRGGFVRNEAIYMPIHDKKTFTSSFTFAKTKIKKPELMEKAFINFKKDKLVGTALYEDIYRVVTLSKKGLLKIYAIDINTLKVSFIEVEGKYRKIYEYMSNSLAIGNTQVDEGKYYDLQTTASKLKSYFIDDKYILETFGTGKNIIRIVDLKTGKFIKKEFSELRENRTSILFEDKYYVFEAIKDTMGFKIFDFNSTVLLSETSFKESDSSIPFQSTVITNEKGEVTNKSDILRIFRKSTKQAHSLGIIPENFENITILTIGVPEYDYVATSYVGANGISTTTQNSKKFSYKYGKTEPNYSSETSFEIWIGADGSIIPYDGTAPQQSTYSRTIQLMNDYIPISTLIVPEFKEIEEGLNNYSKPTVFKFNGEWYYGIYDEKKKQYLIYQI